MDCSSEISSPKHPTVHERSEVSPKAIVGGHNDDQGGDGDTVVASVIEVADGPTKNNKSFAAATPLTNDGSIGRVTECRLNGEPTWLRHLRIETYIPKNDNERSE